jgi:hypothetical protein
MQNIDEMFYDELRKVLVQTKELILNTQFEDDADAASQLLFAFDTLVFSYGFHLVSGLDLDEREDCGAEFPPKNPEELVNKLVERFAFLQQFVIPTEFCSCNKQEMEICDPVEQLTEVLIYIEDTIYLWDNYPKEDALSFLTFAMEMQGMEIIRLLQLYLHKFLKKIENAESSSLEVFSNN